MEEKKMCKRWIEAFSLVIFAAVCFAVVSFGEEKGEFGVGVILGAPTGISAKFWIDKCNAIDEAISWKDNGDIHFHLDYLWHDFDRFKINKGFLPLYYGIGTRFNSGKKAKFGLRGVIGVAYLFSDIPFEAFFEAAPFVQLTPATDAGLDVAIGIRYLIYKQKAGEKSEE